uniref:Uncharacterized protein n=1 Tax=Globisporangium ultimum (strain ATCC 200006 / CBS 805.95 / DAOM BR144) TaxID=431595 RepID=K3WY40_GLOUD
MPVTQEELDYYGRVMCMPLALLINFSLFQYLLTMYCKRRFEFHGMLLLVCGFGSFAALIPFVHRSDSLVNDFNDISETLSTIMLLV